MTRLLVLFLLALSAFAQSPFDGNWDFSMSGPSGEAISAAMTLKSDGAKLSGSIAFGEDRKFELQDGSIDGNKIKFVIKRERSSGGTMVYNMSATLEGDTLKGTTATDMDGNPVSSEWSAKKK
jgi:hypothetical protein